MTFEERVRDKGGRKLTKRRRESQRVSLDIPERFKDGDDAQEDVTAPKRKDIMSMNQSIFSMIARAGQQSQTDLATMQEVDSGDSDDDGKRAVPYHSFDGAARLSRLNTANDFRKPLDDLEDTRTLEGKHRRALSEHKLLRSLPKLKFSGRKEDKRTSLATERMSSSQILPPRPLEDESTATSQDEYPKKQKGKVFPGQDIRVEKQPSLRRSRRSSTTGISKGKAPVTLAKRLQQIFEFEDLEDVISEYPCWLLQSILLQGYMYVTQKHICFYAYIPKKHHDVSKTGYLFKRGRSKYNRYWFILRGDILSYYTNPTDLYFPRNRINLQYAISAGVLESKEKGKDDTTFMVITDERKYQFKADSAVSAKEWVRSIQKVIFRTHNEGNSVKISLPIQNVLEIEESTILDFADTVKVRVIDNDETYAIDEYFFSFFNHGQDALNVLRIMINDNDHHQQSYTQARPTATNPVSRSRSKNREDIAMRDSPIDTPLIKENVRATLSPLPGPHVGRSNSRVSAESGRSSLDVNRRSFDVRRSMDVSRSLRRPSHEVRRSFSGSRYDSQSRSRPGDRSPLSAKPQDSSESATNSFGLGTESSAAVQSIDESNASASQILNRSDVFRAPIIHPPGVSASENSDSAARHSQDTTRSSGAEKARLKSPRPSQRKRSNSPGNEQLRLGTPDVEGEPESQQINTHLSGSSSAIQELVGAASYPLQKASGLAGFLRTRSKRMSNLLATESMGYYEKVSGMLAGGRKHYTTAEGLNPDDQVHGVEEEEDAAKAAEHFREHFALPESEQLQSSYFASLQRVLPNYGKIYISRNYFCFRSLLPGSKTKIILPFKDIENANKEKGFRFGYHGLAIVIRGHEELFFEFSKAEYRDECTVAVLRILESTKYIEDDRSSSSDLDSDDEAAKAEHDLLQEARRATDADASVDVSQIIRGAEHDRIPLIFDDPLASFVDFKPPEPLNIVCLTIGSRGDVQPYIALCKELLNEGHKPRIATHAEFEPWVRKYGIDFAPVDGNPAELMRICVEHGMFTYNFMKEANSKFRGWLDDVCSSAWKACQGADVLIESPSAMAGIHIAEALEIPYFRAFTMPWTRTRTYPHAFSVWDRKLGGAYNSFTYVTFDKIFWTAISGQINRWRRRELGLQNTSLGKMQANARPFLYNFSPQVVPPPLDWPDWIRVTGYWFLDESESWEPPADLLQFIEKARKDKKKLVYVGFGSIVIDDPAALTKTVVDSVSKADVRCVLSKGWSDRLETKDAAKPEVPLGSDIFQIQGAPHDWLFKQMDAAVHHGGSGTTGASLRAGIPTVIKPFFGDQFFFAQRVEDLGVGIWMKKVNTSLFSRALWEATNNQRIIIKAKCLGEKIRKDNGVQVAIQTMYRELDRAKSFVKKHAKLDELDEFDEDWTLVDDDDDEIDIPQQFQHLRIQQPLDGSNRASLDTSRMGTGSMALGSMVLKGANASK
ncbi:glycosyltransferase family 1 protein [Zopfia rhizophila CBS 207.26]|uniref:Sterol 3-beta-glucosyltransferase n=1 Tax=Zopfia rhizophila CBS 207.26 TaxID=1314779 RepID=A0A6A6EW35_9PEZI|nr:glycosyltransferase family 1 protein [Zopfia rhizophila CBS 207.26]